MIDLYLQEMGFIELSINRSPGVYLLLDNMEVLYVGSSTVDVIRRSLQREDIPYNRILITHSQTAEEACRLERKLYRLLKPPYNKAKPYNRPGRRIAWT